MAGAAGNWWDAYPVASDSAPAAAPSGNWWDAYPAAPGAPVDYGAPPEGFVLNPRTGQMEDLRSPANPHVPKGAANAALLGAGQGVGFNLLDEAVGALAGLFGPDGSGEYARETMREAERRAQDDHPAAYYGGLVGGGVLDALVAPLSLGTGANLVDRMALGAVSGAAQGEAAGFGAGEGGFEPRTDEMLQGGRIGAALGAAAPFAISTGRALGRGARNLAASASSAPNPVIAATQIEDALRRSGMSVADVNDEIAAAAADGQPQYTIADALGAAGQRKLNGVTRLPGAGQVLAETDLRARQAGQGDRVSAFLADALDAPDTAAQRVTALEAARKTAADAAYGAAHVDASSVDVNDALALIDARLADVTDLNIVGDGTDAAYAKFARRLRGAGEDDAPQVLSDFKRVLGIKQDIEDVIKEALRSGKGNQASALAALKSKLDTALEDASPAYRAANDDYARASGVIRSVEAGKSAAAPRTRHPDVADRFAGLTPDEQTAFRAGYADPLLARIEASAGPTTNRARALTGEKTVSDLALLAKDPELLQRRIGRENVMHATAGRSLFGSQTADNLGDAADVASGGAHLAGEFAVNPNWALRRGAGALVNAIVNGARGTNEATREMIARGLLSQDIAVALQPRYDQMAGVEAWNRALDPTLRSGLVRLFTGGS